MEQLDYIYIVEEIYFYYDRNGIRQQGTHNASEMHLFKTKEDANTWIKYLIRENDWKKFNKGIYREIEEQYIRIKTIRKTKYEEFIKLWRKRI